MVRRNTANTHPGSSSEKEAVENDVVREAFAQHYAALLRYSYLLSGDRHVAEDLVQEAFVRASPKLSSIANSDVGSYLTRAIVNLWRNRIRRLVIERRARGRVEVISSVDFDEAVSVRDEVWAALASLPPRQRACLVLRYYEDLSERSIANILGCSTGTVKSQLSKAIAKLRKELSGNGS